MAVIILGSFGGKHGSTDNASDGAVAVSEVRLEKYAIPGEVWVVPSAEPAVVEVLSEPIVVSPEPAPQFPFSEIVCSYSWDCRTAERIIRCESTFRPDATNGISWGLWQIWSGHQGRWGDFWESWADPVRNTQWAYEIWLTRGWEAWSCY